MDVVILDSIEALEIPLVDLVGWPHSSPFVFAGYVFQSLFLFLHEKLEIYNVLHNL